MQSLNTYYHPLIPRSCTPAADDQRGKEKTFFRFFHSSELSIECVETGTPLLTFSLLPPLTLVSHSLILYPRYVTIGPSVKYFTRFSHGSNQEPLPKHRSYKTNSDQNGSALLWLWVARQEGYSVGRFVHGDVYKSFHFGR